MSKEKLIEIDRLVKEYNLESKEKLNEIERLIKEYNSESHKYDGLILEKTIYECCLYEKCQRNCHCECKQKFQELPESERSKFAYANGEIFPYYHADSEYLGSYRS
jgi:hypothetical protein